MLPLQTTQFLLIAGVCAAAIFFAVATAESVLRPGFDIKKHAISMLSLGERGWLMAGTFVLSGILTIAFAGGVYRAADSVLLTILPGLYGIGLVVAGIFPAPAGLGFPPGTPDDQMPVMNRSATLHSIGFMVGFGSVILSAFAFAFHFASVGSPGLAIFCGLIGVLIPVLIGVGVANIIATGIAFYMAAMLAWLLVAVASLRFLAQ